MHINGIDIVERAANDSGHQRLESYLEGQRIRLQRVRDMVAEIHNHGRIVEAGAEPYLLQLLLEKTINGEVVGLDLNPDRYNEFIDDWDLDVRKCDMENEEFPLESAEIVVLSEVFEHLCDPLRVLNKIRSLLHPGGYLVLTTPNLHRLETWVRFISGKGFDDAYRQWEKQFDIGHMGHVRIYTQDQIQTFLEKSGFEVLESHYERFGASDRSAPAGPVLTVLYRVAPPLRPFQSHVAKVDDMTM